MGQGIHPGGQGIRNRTVITTHIDVNDLSFILNYQNDRALILIFAWTHLKLWKEDVTYR